MSRKIALVSIAAAVLAVPAVAQMAAPAAAPVVRAIGGTPDTGKVAAGTYAVDTNHTQILWSANHLGFNDYFGIFGNTKGSLTIDPANPAAASVSIDIPINAVVTNREGLTDHLQNADFFDAAAHPVATFRSTGVTVSGTDAKIAGTLTLRGVSKPVVLDAKFTGAGINPMNKKATVGFHATTQLKRSDFGILYGLPGVSDTVDIKISVAFEKAA